MDELIDLLQGATKKMRIVASKLLKAHQMDLCDEIDALADDLDVALKKAVDFKLEIKPLGSENSAIPSPVALKQELDAVADRMRKLKEKMQSD